LSTLEGRGKVGKGEGFVGQCRPEKRGKRRGGRVGEVFPSPIETRRKRGKQIWNAALGGESRLNTNNLIEDDIKDKRKKLAREG